MKDLASPPDQWENAELGQISEVIRGITFPVSAKEFQKTGANVCCLRTTNIQREIDWSDVYFIPRSHVKRDDQLVQLGDVLMSMANSYELVGKVAVAREVPLGTAFGAFLAAIRPRAGINGQYLFHLLRTPYVQRELRKGSNQTVNIANISAKALAAIPIPVAPSEEQDRIAAKLDTVLGRLDACGARLDRVPPILKKFREAVLQAAVSGRLTAEWRNDSKFTPATGQSVVVVDAEAKRLMLISYPELAKKKSTLESSVDRDYLFDIPDTWAFTTWGTVSEWVTYGFTRPMPHVDDGVPLITAKDVQNFKVMMDQVQFTSAEAFETLSEKDRPKPGDLLLTKDGTIGRAALVETVRAFCINQSVAVVWLRSTSMSKRYLQLVANTQFTQEFIRDKAKGMAIQHLSITDFAQCPIPVPPAREQVEIVRRVDILLTLADDLQRRYQKTAMRIETLTPSILSKAFRGELVPQDPNDEPASVLMERMKAEPIAGTSERKESGAPLRKARAVRRGTS